MLFSFLSSLKGMFFPKNNQAMQIPKHDYPPQLDHLSNQTIIMDVERALLMSNSMFPYFMLVALEAGSFLRGILLLLSYPFVCLLNEGLGLRVMAMVCFFGIKKEGFREGRAVLAKWFLEDVGLQGFEMMRRGGRKVCFSRMPRIMVEPFLREYLEVDVVVGGELKEFHGYYTGLMEDYNWVQKLALKELSGGDGKEVGIHGAQLIGITGFSNPLHHPIFSSCKEIYLVPEIEKMKWNPLPRKMYPKPLVFHDGRMAFRPTASSTMAMFIWLPYGLLLAIYRILICLLMPYKLTILILALTRMKLRITNGVIPKSSNISRGSLYVCNHRTLADPLYISISLNKPVIGVTYSLSRFTEVISPIKTTRLSRNREVDGKKMDKLLSQGENVVVCPEGTTGREPYLLRFSPLFTEISDKITPVAVDVYVSMFYATTTRGFKWLDPLYFLMNPSVCYELNFLECIDTTMVRNGECSSTDMANYVQECIARELGFECTKLTRRDKYFILAGNDGRSEINDKLAKKG